LTASLGHSSVQQVQKGQEQRKGFLSWAVRPVVTCEPGVATILIQCKVALLLTGRAWPDNGPWLLSSIPDAFSCLCLSPHVMQR
jgi:hypothetical protein